MTDDMIARVGSLEVYLDVTLLVAIAGVVWTFARRISQELYFQLSLRTREIEIELSPLPEVPKEIKELYLLFIRYGNDTYLKELASDQERYHGRLRNKVTKIDVDATRIGDGPIKVRLKIHKRLGTQFKFFIEVEGDPKPVVEYLERHDTVEKIEVVERPYRGKGDEGRSRVFFIISRLQTVETVDGFENNFIFPV
ncbi:hypothetical protein [Roseovarius sp. 2305UL8-3]|uniref:hypothetical protein n=1 Tax=Roseovarius conchicola TaxID=3121636 RepID=UPI0035287334